MVSGIVSSKSSTISQADPILAAVRTAVLRHQLFPPSNSPKSTVRQPVVVGVSGGADSICLVHALAQFQAIWGLELHVAHLNHNLRPEGATDAAFVASVASRLSLPFHVGSVQKEQLVNTDLGIEGAARQFRYRFLIAVARAITPPGQQPILAMAHHGDDQAETIVMNLIRGSGPLGLSGMEWHSLRQTDAGRGTVAVIRPFLALRRQDIVDFLHRHNIPWVEDETNQDPAFLRNRIRHEVMPLLREINPNLTQTIGRTAETFQAEVTRSMAWDRAAFEEVQVSPAGAEASDPQSAERAVLDLSRLLAHDLATQRNVIRLALAQVAGGQQWDNQQRDNQRRDSQLQNHQLHNIGFDVVESLREAIQKEAAAGVSHPIAQGVAWTIGNPSGERPLLSIHQADRLPFLPEQPFLDEIWQRRHSHVAIPFSGLLPCPNGWTLRVKEMQIAMLPKNWQTTKGDWEAYIDRDTAGEIHLTTPTSRQRFMPLGMDGQHQSIANLLTNRKVLKSFRNGWPIIVSSSTVLENTVLENTVSENRGAENRDPDDAGQVLWICGLQLAAPARITEETQHVLHLQWLKM